MKHYIGLFLRGMAMGAADVVPGVSGGTIAFITGIYSTLLQSLSRFGLSLISVFKNDGLVAASRHVNASFLLPLFAGITLSILSLARVITYLLESEPLLVWSFFFGLILASSLFVLRQITRWSPSVIVLLLVGVLLALIVAQLRPVEVVAGYGYLFMAGSIAICAMILPGISGSFILLLLGVYAQVLEAVRILDFSSIAAFGTGCIVGLLSFVKLLNWLLEHYYQRVLALLSGFIAGSLYMVWPWKEVVQMYTNSHGIEKPLVQVNVLPGQFEQVAGQSAQLVGCLSLMISAVVIVLILEKLGGKEADNVAPE
ncbi:putative membrane protein [Sinobacterium caligoides]|uniref:Putative membrane protein n=1 Tax=Sinobacterium caligoides TaxID=933926 RepID=A0A3N2DMW7_9GAMM|nr:DUF368 domain-containing protein [Sinobacterium caligoides]ROS01022.1 putative membrane protein [Sinobacterium caligoides]